MEKGVTIYRQNLRELEGASGNFLYKGATEGSLFFLYNRWFKTGSTALDYIEVKQKPSKAINPKKESVQCPNADNTGLHVERQKISDVKLIGWESLLYQVTIGAGTNCLLLLNKQLPISTIY